MTQLKRLENSTLFFPRQIISRRGRQGSGISFPDSQSTCKGKNKRLMLVNCLPLLYLKQQISGITRWKWIYITIPELTPSAIFHVHEHKVSLRSSIRQSFYCWCKTTWNWHISFTKFPVFPGLQGLQKPNPPHFPHLQGKMIVQTPLKVPIYKVVFARGPHPRGWPMTDA